jgi:hypothetical protein
MIQPVYVTFEQAKWLKEKGFDEECSHSYKEVEPVILYQHQGKKYNNSFKKEWQNTVRKNSHMDNAIINRYSAPEQHVVVEWLRIKYGIWVAVRGKEVMGYEYFIEGKGETLFSSNIYDTPQEAYSAAFDYVLNNLI